MFVDQNISKCRKGTVQKLGGPFTSIIILRGTPSYLGPSLPETSFAVQALWRKNVTKICSSLFSFIVLVVSVHALIELEISILDCHLVWELKELDIKVLPRILFLFICGQ